ncbi:MAG: tRNA lysidine(34) synthetase TilS [Bacilli bacterium]|nr:tRNA lysidine(34) synthetase TilS [Bacilli bacterium]
MINIEDNFKFHNNDVIIVGCSSGPDSMALVDMVNKLKDKYNLKVIVAHVNYHVREESLEESEYVKEYCEKNNLIFEYFYVDKYGDDNFENEARRIRYKFFGRLAKKYEAKYVMTAHHADDLMETILMKLVRGSNLNGYAGFKSEVQRRGYKVIRPLISYTKDELIDYCERNKIKYYVDKTNSDPFYTRNRYRKYILPFLKKENKDVHKKFLKFSKTLLEVNDYIGVETNNALDRCFKDNKIDVDKFKLEDKFIQKEMLYKLLSESFQDDLILVSDKHIDLILDLINSKKANNKVLLPNNISFIKKYNYIEIIDNSEEDIDDYSFEFIDNLLLPNGRKIERVESTDDKSNNTIRLNSEEIKLPIIVRNRRNGDKIKIKNLNGSKKIKDIFIDEKIDIHDRDKWPIVCDYEGTVLWVPGVKKSSFDKSMNDSYDIILKYI